MSKLTIRLLLAAGLMHSAGVIAAEIIPSHFHGFWERAEFCSTALEVGVPDTGAIIDGRTLQGYENACSVSNLIAAGQSALEVDLVCENSDGEYEETAELRLYDDKYLVIAYGGSPSWPLVRCY